MLASRPFPLQPKRYAKIVAVMVPRETWTDERLDDLSRKVDDGFARLDADIRGLRGDLNSQGDSLRAELHRQGNSLRAELKSHGDSLRAELNRQGEGLRAEIATQGEGLRAELKSQDESLRGEISSLRNEMNARFDAANRNLIGVAVAIIAAIIGSNSF